MPLDSIMLAMFIIGIMALVTVVVSLLTQGHPLDYMVGLLGVFVGTAVYFMVLDLDMHQRSTRQFMQSSDEAISRVMANDPNWQVCFDCREADGTTGKRCVAVPPVPIDTVDRTMFPAHCHAVPTSTEQGGEE